MPDSQKIVCRRLDAEEKLSLTRLQNFVFQFGKNEDEIRAKIASGDYTGNGVYGAVDESGRVLAGMDVFPFTMWFDGRKVPMSGIANVASAPESRRQGNIRKVFSGVFRDIYEEGAVFSHLYPFSFDYYRQFGYEHCGAAKRYTLPLAPARRLKNTGEAREYLNGDPARGRLIEIHEAFGSRHNAMISRPEKGWWQEGWDKLLDITLFGAIRLYYWVDAGGEVKSWVRFRKDNNEMQIFDIAWADHESMLGILRFMGMFDGSADKMVFTVSPEFVPDLYWNELAFIGETNSWLGMSRVINAKRALELIRKPGGEGRFSVKISDGMASWNERTYEVEYGGGECEVTARENLAADVEVTERALSQMVLGVYGFERIALRDDVRVNGNAPTLEKVFCKKNLLITDYY